MCGFLWRVSRRQATQNEKQRQEQWQWQWQRRDTEAKTGEGRVRGLMGLKKGREILTEKRGCSAAVRCSEVRCGAVLREWRKSPGVGRARESMVPFIIRYCRPEAVNDNDARARRGEAGQAGRDEPGQAWQGQNALSASQSQLLLSPVWIWLGGLLTFWALDLLTSDGWSGRGLIWSSRREETEVS